MERKGGKKFVCIPKRQWQIIENQAANTYETIQPINVQMPVKQNFLKPHFEPILPLKNSTRLNKTELGEFISSSKRMIAEKEGKKLPINLKSAVFLADVFSEKKNQLQFRKATQRLWWEQKGKENRKVLNDEGVKKQSEYLRKNENLQSQAMLRKQLKEEIADLKLREKSQRTEEIDKEHVKLKEIEDEVTEVKRTEEMQELEKKKMLQELHSDDLRAKRETRLVNDVVENEENKLLKSQLNYHYTTREMHRKHCKLVRIKKMEHLAKCNYYAKEKLKEHPPCFNELPIVKKSKIEEKREMYQDRLKKERINMHNLQSQELQKKLILQSEEKKMEFKQRYENVNVTNLFERQRKQKIFRQMMECQDIWNKQCIERKHIQQRDKEEEKRRRETLMNTLVLEDKEFLQTANSILKEYEARGKVTVPLHKCILDYNKNVSVMNQCGIST